MSMNMSMNTDMDVDESLDDCPNDCQLIFIGGASEEKEIPEPVVVRQSPNMSGIVSRVERNILSLYASSLDYDYIQYMLAGYYSITKEYIQKQNFSLAIKKINEHRSKNNIPLLSTEEKNEMIVFYDNIFKSTEEFKNDHNKEILDSMMGLFNEDERRKADSLLLPYETSDNRYELYVHKIK